MVKLTQRFRSIDCNIVTDKRKLNADATIKYLLKYSSDIDRTLRIELFTFIQPNYSPSIWAHIDVSIHILPSIHRHMLNGVHCKCTMYFSNANITLVWSSESRENQEAKIWIKATVIQLHLQIPFKQLDTANSVCTISSLL